MNIDYTLLINAKSFINYLANGNTILLTEGNKKSVLTSENEIKHLLFALLI